MMSIRRKIQPTASIKSISFEGVCNNEGHDSEESPNDDGDYSRATLFKKPIKHKASIGQFGNIVKILGDTLLLLLSHRSPIS